MLLYSQSSAVTRRLRDRTGAAQKEAECFHTTLIGVFDWSNVSAAEPGRLRAARGKEQGLSADRHTCTATTGSM